MTRARLGLAAACIFLSGCGRGGGAPSELSSFTDSYFRSYFDFNPSEGTANGLHEYDTKLENRSSARVQNRMSELEQQAGQIAGIRKRNLSASDATDAVLLENRIRSELLDLQTLRTWRSPLYYSGIPGNAVDSLMKRNFAPPPERLASVIARTRQIPALIDAMRENTFEPPREFTELAIRIVSGSIPFFRDSVSEWARSAAAGDQRLLTEFADANRKAVESLQLILDHLNRDVLPLSTGSYAIGAASYAKKLLYDEMVDTDLTALLDTGEKHMQADYDAFLQTARLVAPGKPPAEAVKVLNADHPVENGLMDFASATLENARRFVVSHNIVPIPSEERARVLPTPPYARSGTFASMDTPGAYETSAREAFYYVTPTEPWWTAEHKTEHLKLYNRPVMDMITVHEAYPGHYVQFLYAKQFPTKVRKLTSCGSNAEGWAHYAEQMMVEEGFGGGDPKIRLAQLSEALVRDARYIAGIRMHTRGWSVDQATQLFVEKAFMEHSNAREEARRGTYNPTYLYYTLGKMQIYKLRDDYRKAKGTGYSLGQFHSEFVKQGAIPIRLIRQILLPEDSRSTQ